jgi:hypothetical protein
MAAVGSTMWRVSLFQQGDARVPCSKERERDAPHDGFFFFYRVQLSPYVERSGARA